MRALLPCDEESLESDQEESIQEEEGTRTLRLTKGKGSAPEEEDIVFKLQEDAFDGAVLVLNQMADENYVSVKGYGAAVRNLIQGLLMYAFAYFSQALLIFMLLIYSDQRIQDPFEHGLGTMTKDLRSALDNGKQLDSTGHTMTMCMNDHSVPWSQSAVSFLWMCKTMPAVMEALWQIFLFRIMRNIQPGESIIEDVDSEKIAISKSSPCLKVLLTLLVGVPRLVIAVFLMATGMEYLMFCGSVGMLVMKALSLGFIIEIPKIVFKGLASKQFAALTSQCTFHARGVRNVAWDTWASMATKCVVILVVTLWYCRIYCGPLQAWRETCLAYKYEFVFSKCPDCGVSIAGMRFAN